MGTEKRQRQKANRAQREQELARTQARRRTVRIVAIVVGAVVALAVLVWVVGALTGDGSDAGANTPSPVTIDENEPEPTTDDTATADTESAADCPPEEGADEPTQSFAEPPPFCLDEDTDHRAVVTTNKGEFTIDLDAERAPETVNNFVFLARNRYFDDTRCHRIIPGFVVQCGDPTGTGTGDPGYRIADELPDAGEYAIGSIAMANSGPDTNGSQFFIITGEQGAALPPQYSLFGEVSDGFDDTVVSMEAAGTASGTPTDDVVIESVVITTG